MARKRNEACAHLPPNLYKDQTGYFAYRDPVTRKKSGVGRDESVAISAATESNKKHDALKAEASSRRIAVVKSRGAMDKSGLVELRFIQENAEQFDKVSGVYFLLCDGEIVYVGQSTSCHNRLAEHARAKDKIFDSYYIIRTHQESLLVLESLYIDKYKPKYNATTSKSSRKTAWGLMQRYGDS